MRRTINLFILAIAFCATLSTSAQTVNSSKLDSLLLALDKANKAMGSVAIAQNGNVVYAKAFGYSQLSDAGNIAATPQTRYRIGSISKVFTATMVMQLVDEGKLTLSTTLDRFYPQIPNSEKITIDQLLSHRSGIHSFTSDPDYPKWMMNPKTHEELIALISGYKPDFEPNAKYAYSNSNYVLLSYIIEKLDKRSFEKSLDKRIIRKVGLKNTYYGKKTDVKNNESYSYSKKIKWEKEVETDMSIPSGAGAIVSTPSDLTIFANALFTKNLVSDSSLAAMTRTRDGYGLGLMSMNFGEEKGYGHGGAIDGFLNQVVYFPEKSLTIAFSLNGMNYSLDKIVKGIGSICFNQPYSIPNFKTIALKTEDLDKYLGVYASKTIPLKITVTKDADILLVQATNQGAFAVDAIDIDKFRNDRYGIELEFDTEKKEVILNQRGMKLVFSIEK